MDETCPFKMENRFRRYSKRLLKIALGFFCKTALKVGFVEQPHFHQSSQE
jgi:hypothetical protein